MRDHMPKEKLSDKDRRALVLGALGGAQKTALAEKFGVSRRWVHNLVEEAKQDPEGKLAEIEAEAAFRREVRDLLTGKAQQEDA